MYKRGRLDYPNVCIPPRNRLLSILLPESPLRLSLIINILGTKTLSDKDGNKKEYDSFHVKLFLGWNIKYAQNTLKRENSCEGM